MKKLCCFLSIILFLTVSCSDNNTSHQNIQPDKIYFFYADTCPHCHDADAYIKENHPDLKIIKINVAEKSGFELFIKCARRFNLGQNIGTPLFCMGNNYIMGWAPHYAKRFDRYAKPFKK